MKLGRKAVVVLLMAVTVVAVGCSPKRKSPTPATPTAPSLRPPSADSQKSAEDTALTAYRGMIQAYVAAGRTTSPQYTDLARYAEGDALNVLVAGLETNRKQGLITKGDVLVNPQVTQLSPVDSPDTAAIQDCLDTSGATRVKASPTGPPFTDTPGGRRSVSATARKSSGTWKVISFIPMAVGTC